MSAREVSFDSGGCSLAGTYAEAADPVAAALLITGSGKTDRDSDVHLPLHQMLRGGITRQVSDSLVAARVSALRYDKRGVGASGGDYMSAGMTQQLADARAAPRMACGRSCRAAFSGDRAQRGDLLCGCARRRRRSRRGGAAVWLRAHRCRASHLADAEDG